MVKKLLVLLVILVAGAVVFYQQTNPEKGPLDEAARLAGGGRYLSLSDGTTHYDLAGPEDGQRVVLVHGFSVPYYIWDSTTTALAGAGFRVARYDTYGRGFSDRPDIEYRLDLFTRQLGDLLDSLGWTGPVDLMGLSAGGPIVASFAGRYPSRVRSVVFVDPAAGPAGPLPSLFRLPVFGGLLWQVMAVPSMADNQTSDFVDPARWPDWADRYRVQMRYRGFGRALRSTLLARATVSTDTLYARFGTLGVRSLLIWGKEDQTVPIEYAETLRKGIPALEYHPVDGAGHLPHMERTDVVNPLLIGFLRRTDADTIGASPER